MNEQRQQAYLHVIKTLLYCPNAEKLEILAANRDLLDAEFLQVVELVAEELSERGDKNTANRLRNLGNQLANALNINYPQTQKRKLTREDILASFEFFMEVLQAIKESNGDAEVIYPLLAANTDKLDDVIFPDILRRWAISEFEQQKADKAVFIAGVINNFGNLMRNFSLGDRASNIEIAIASDETVLKIFTREAFPEYWALTQRNLGKSYKNRIKGDKAENIENAISFYQAALQVYIREDFPQDWSITQNYLGNAYSDRIKGDKAENIENAISYHQAALQVYIREDFPEDWAKIQNGLGIAYSDRIKGDKAENIENAISYHQAALQVYIREDFPEDWAIIQNGLGNAYSNRIKGDKAENIENAISYYQAALQVRTYEDSPQGWAMTQYNLANAYSVRIKGNKVENIENVIRYYKAVLLVYTNRAFPQEWATTQNSLGVIYKNRIKGDKAENIENAIKAFQAALQVYSRETFPQDWARTQNNLGNAYIEILNANKAENIENAIKAFQAALEVYTRQAFPESWAVIQNNLGNAYSKRIKEDKVENIENAISYYQAALQIRTHQAYPQNYVETSFNLGIMYQNKGRFASAFNTFESAIATVESLREEIVSGEESRRKQAEEWNKLHLGMVEVCLELGKFTEAIEYVERSKTRNLVEQILERDSKTIFPPEVFTQLEKYRDEIAVGQYQIQNRKAENPKVLAQHLQELRKQRNQLQNEYLPIGYDFKFDSFQGSLDEHTAIIEWYILDDKILAFIVTKKVEVTVWQSQSEDREALYDWVNQYLHNYYYQKDQWRNNLGEALKKLASILHIDEILNQIPNHCDKLILIPHRLLHLLPLHALPVTSQNNQDSLYLLDVFPGGVSYAPSCQILQQVQKRDRPNFQSLFAIQNPTEDLAFTDLEVETILSYFPSHQVLPKKQATKAALSQAERQLKQANYLHFSCHGSFNFNSPQNSCLLLAESVDENNNLDLSKCLTLGNLFERTFDFSQTRLVVLSACETGLVDFNNTSDEYISLPSGFLYAGSSSVVSSLWTVSDLSTAFLMIKFIQNLKATMVNNEYFSVAVELQKAQLWLRNATTAELQKWVNDLKLSPEQAQKNYETLDWFDVDEKPFQNPVYWAAFCAIGQ
ncbi:MAG: CHAT domain-containing protein [Cyanobacteria bacterium J06633_8]